MDLGGGGILNLSGIEMLHKIEIMHKLPESKCILPAAAEQDVECKGITSSSPCNAQELTWQHVWLREGCIGFHIMDLFI